MRVLHVISGIDPRLGGATTAFIQLLTAQVDAGLSVVGLSTYRPDHDNLLAGPLRATGVDVRLVGPATGPFQRHPDLRPSMRAAIEGCDVVHIHGCWEQVQHEAARAARRARIPYVFQPHGMLAPWSLSQRAWKKRAYLWFRLGPDLRRAAAMAYTTDAERDGSAALRLRPPALVEGLGVDLSEFATMPGREELGERYPVLQDRTVVLFLSRLHYKKGSTRLIDAFARVAPQHPEASLVLAGPGEDADVAALHARVEAAGIADRVVFTGMLHGRDRMVAYAGADVFVLPSLQENFGVVVAESASAGCPVLISDQVNLADWVTTAGAGEVFPLTDDALPEMLSAWLGDPTRRERVGRRARAAAREAFDWSLIGRRWVEHYRGLARP